MSQKLIATLKNPPKLIAKMNKTILKIYPELEPIIEEITALKEENANQEELIEQLQEKNTNQDKLIEELKEENSNQEELIDGLEEKNKSQDELIENLKEENKTQDNLIKELQEENTLVKSQIPEGQEKDEYITLKDSSNMQMKLGVQGNSWQETRSGKNLFNFKDIIYESAYAPVALEGNESEFTLSISNDITYSSYDFKIWNVGIIDSDNIYVNFNSNRSGVTNNTELGIVYVSPDGGVANRKSLRSLLTPQTKYKINTSEYKGQYLFIMFRANIPNLFTSQTITNLTVSTEEMTEYEKYGAMPSPEFPSEIKNVTGSVNAIVTNENMLYDGWAEDFVKRINNEVRANITTINGKKYLYFLASAGYVAGQSFKEFRQYFIKGIFKEKTRYTFSGKIMVDTERYEVNIIIRYTDGTSDYKLLTSKATAMKEFDFSLLSDPSKTIEHIGVQYQTGGTFIDLSTATLKEGTSTDYIQNETQKFTFPLAEGQRMPISSYPADDGIHHKRCQDIITSNEVIGSYKSDTTKGFCGFSVKSHYKHVSEADETLLLSNYFIDHGGYVYGNSKSGIWAPNLSTTIYICVPVSMLADVSSAEAQIASFKTLLTELYEKGKPVTVEYTLAEEIIEPYTEEQQIVYNEIKKASSYKNVTHIFSTDEISPVFEVTYKKDLETMFNNINNAMLGGN